MGKNENKKRILTIGSNSPRHILRWMGANLLLADTEVTEPTEGIIVLHQPDGIIVLHPVSMEDPEVRRFVER